MATTPTKVNREVKEFCYRYLSHEKPIYIKVTPLGTPGECFGNVANYVIANGGKAIHGWQVWHIPKRFIEGEFHCVWQSDDGEFLDITPKASGEKKILFVHDPKLVFENRQIPNRRLKLSENDPFIDYMIFSGEETEKLDARYLNEKGQPEVPLVQQIQLTKMLQQKLTSLVQLRQVTKEDLKLLTESRI